MIFDLTCLLNQEKKEIPVDLYFSVIHLCKDFITADARIKGKFVNHEGFLELTAVIFVDYTALCSRCAEYYAGFLEYHVKLPVTDELVNEEENFEYIMLENGKIDTEAVFTDQLILLLPSKFLCNDDCRGLCVSCGKNLNEGKCSCDKKKIDPRLSVLKNFFDDK